MGRFVVGAGWRLGTDPEAVCALAGAVLAELAGEGLVVVVAIATLEGKAAEAPATALSARLAAPIVGLLPATLAAVAVPNPSPLVAASVGTASVAEAAALAVAGPGAVLARAKRSAGGATVAVARCRAISPSCRSGRC